MAENVIILGAGASADSGAPLMLDFLDRADHFLRAGVFDKDNDAIGKVYKAFAELNKIYAKSTLNSRNLETFFGAIEMARVIGRFGDYSNKDVEEIYDGLIKLIVGTLERTTIFHSKPLVVDSVSKYSTKGSYSNLVEGIMEMGVENTALITFNYDIALDYELVAANIEIDYCLPNRQNGIRLHKLHGSTNWGACDICGLIIPYRINEYIDKHGFNEIDKKTAVIYGDKSYFAEGTHVATLPVGNNFSDLILHHSDHGRKTSFSPAIIPPTWTKSQYRGSIASVWASAADDLQSAKNIYVLGYSLPETDSFFRYLYALGSIGYQRIEKFWVINSSKDQDTFEKYRELIGDAVEDRFYYFPAYIERVARYFYNMDLNRFGISFYDDFQEKIRPKP